MFTDNLPMSGLSYGPVSVVNTSGVNCTEHISCTIGGTSDLACSGSGGEVIIHPEGSFDVEISAEAAVDGTFTNPRLLGDCRVDPVFLVDESDETNNDCSDTVTLLQLDIMLAGDDLEFTWGDVGAAAYKVWLDFDDPYDIPGPDCGGSIYCMTGSSTAAEVVGAGSDGSNYFFIVEAVDDTGNVFATSNHAAKFFFGLTPGEPGND
jgi:hypothetical protein